MARLPFFLIRSRRRRRRDLIEFVDALCLYTYVGWDLAHAWQEAAATLRPNMRSDLGDLIRSKEDGGNLSGLLTQLSLAYPDPAHRLWFAAISTLYQTGSSIADALRAVSNSLRQEQQ